MNHKRLEINPINILLELFEVSGESMVKFYDFVIEFPDLLNREYKRNDGLLQKLLFIIKKNVLKQKQITSNRIVIKSQQEGEEGMLAETEPVDTLLSNTTTTSSSSSTIMSSPMKNTHITTTTTTSYTTTTSVDKVSSLENELTRLREEIARIMSNGVDSTTPAINSTCNNITSSIPPPPPPPLPPAVKTSTLNLKKKTSSNNTSESVPTTPIKPVLSITDILKNGSKGVQLKKSTVNRSPGGTPIRDITNKKSTIDTHQEFIAKALQNKFKNIYQSPEKPKTPSKKRVKSLNDSLFSDSDDDTFENNENILSN